MNFYILKVVLNLLICIVLKDGLVLVAKVLIIRLAVLQAWP